MDSPQFHNIMVKNTFLDVPHLEHEDFVEKRRSSSTPRAWKPASCRRVRGAGLELDDSSPSVGHSDASTAGSSASASSSSEKDEFEDCLDHEVDSDIDAHTAASDIDVSEEDLEEEVPAVVEDYGVPSTDDEWEDRFDHVCFNSDIPLTDDEADEFDFCGDCGPTFEAIPSPPEANKVTLSLFDSVLTDVGKVPATVGTGRTRLKAQARPFQSIRAPDPETSMIINDTQEVLRSICGITDVEVIDGGMSGTTMLVAKAGCGLEDVRQVLTFAQETLLSSAERSENTYILGYNARPFHNLDSSSFSATIVRVPIGHQDTACWDTYENGTCPRCKNCRWDHPSDTDMMRVIVMVKA